MKAIGNLILGIFAGSLAALTIIVNNAFAASMLMAAATFNFTLFIQDNPKEGNKQQ